MSVLCIVLALTGVVALGIWGAYRDVGQAATAIRRSAISRVNSHAERTAGRIESHLVEDGLGTDLTKLREARWLRDHLSDEDWRQPGEIYEAIVAQDGEIIVHSERGREGKELLHSSEDRALESFGGAYVFETESAELTGGRRAYDVRVPIRFASTPVGTYHAGLDLQWLDEQVATVTQGVLRRWMVVIGGILGVVALAVASLGSIMRRATTLQRQLLDAKLERAEELRQVMAGLAHEIRNPLNAVRLNLHTMERLFRREAWLSDDEVGAMLRESTREVERMADLMNEALGLARPDRSPREDISVTRELRAVCDLLRPAFDAQGTELQIRAASEGQRVRIEPGQMRQVLQNLLNNAREAVGQGGSVEIVVEPTRRGCEVRIRDSGPGVASADRRRIFEPFYSTKEQGVGLGLAIARKLVEGAGGELECVEPPGGGAMFRLVLPASDSAPTEELVA